MSQQPILHFRTGFDQFLLHAVLGPHLSYHHPISQLSPFDPPKKDWIHDDKCSDLSNQLPLQPMMPLWETLSGFMYLVGCSPTKP